MSRPADAAAGQRWLQGLAFSIGVAAVLPQALGPALLLLVAVSWLAIPRERHQRVRQRPSWTVVLVIAAFVLWPTLLALMHTPHTDTVIRVFHLVRVAVVLWLCSLFSRSEARWLVWGVLAGAALVLLIRAVNALHTLPLWAVWYKILVREGTQTARIWIMVTLSGAICLGFALQAMRAPQGKALLGMAGWLVLSCAVAVMTISRNAQLLLVALPVAAVAYVFRSARGWVWAGLICIGLAATAWWAAPTVQPRMLEAYREWQQVVDQGDCSTSIGSRWGMWAFALQQWASSPWIGTGPGSFHALWIPHANLLCPESAPTRQPHNDYLLFGMETGWPGLASLLALLALLLRRCWVSPENPFGLIGVLTWVTLTITALFNSPLRDAGLGFPMLVLLGACAGQCLADEKDTATPAREQSRLGAMQASTVSLPSSRHDEAAQEAPLKGD